MSSQSSIESKQEKNYWTQTKLATREVTCNIWGICSLHCGSRSGRSRKGVCAGNLGTSRLLDCCWLLWRCADRHKTTRLWGWWHAANNRAWYHDIWLWYSCSWIYLLLSSLPQSKESKLTFYTSMALTAILTKQTTQKIDHTNNHTISHLLATLNTQNLSVENHAHKYNIHKNHSC